MKTNALCWNPMEAFNFIAANEDHNVYDTARLAQRLPNHRFGFRWRLKIETRNRYTFDMRKMESAMNVHKGGE